MRYIYADNSATTAISPTVLEKMMPVLTEYYGNPSSLYRIGGKAKEILENSRENIAKNLGAANANEIYFTSGGTKSWCVWRLSPFMTDGRGVTLSTCRAQVKTQAGHKLNPASSIS